MCLEDTYFFSLLALFEEKERSKAKSMLMAGSKGRFKVPLTHDYLSLVTLTTSLLPLLSLHLFTPSFATFLPRS